MSQVMDVIIRNASMVTMQPGEAGYQVTPPGDIAIKDGKIHSLHPSHCELDFSQEFDCQGQLLTPGLIDCHTHLVFAGSRANEFEMRLNGVPYEQIARQGGGIVATVKATRQASEEQLLELALPRLDGLLRTGVTTVEVKSGYGLTLNDELKMLRAAKRLSDHRKVNVTTTLLAAHAVPGEYQNRADAYIDYVCEEIIPATAEQQLADSVDVFCESIGFNLEQTERVFQAAQKHKLAIKGHTEQLSNLGGSALTARYHGLSVDHVEFLDQAGVAALADAGTVATLLPGAFYFLRESQLPPIDLLRQYQVPMAIGSDFNPGTSPIADLTMMMNMACTLFRLTPEEALRGVTCHAAQALGQANLRGKIQPGFAADFAVWQLRHPAELSYQVGVSQLTARIVNGEICHG
ncbi:imidazolonepropionase [Vibrio sp.]|uniref:imidazolonepropionase n=1 Tax=Vibrio sp. TaxID=678 RepID=UPI003D0A8930